jgi:hypothetical protein
MEMSSTVDIRGFTMLQVRAEKSAGDGAAVMVDRMN